MKAWIVAFFLLAGPALGRQETPGVDLYGDRLPKGAIRRFGTHRFRGLYEMRNLALSPDGTILALNKPRYPDLSERPDPGVRGPVQSGDPSSRGRHR